MTPARARSVLLVTSVVAVVAAFGVGRAVDAGAFASLFGDPAETGTVADVPDGVVPPPGVPRAAQRATVDRVVDGDTIRVTVRAGSGAIPAAPSASVRLLNVDAPETRHPSRGVECGGPEATARVEQLLPAGATVWLASDRSDTDRYDRYLRAVWTGDGVFVNAALVGEGLATAVLFPPDDRWYPELVELEQAAREAAVGNWSRCP